jgi:two-component system, sensor histidine kinase and response regulator
MSADILIVDDTVANLNILNAMLSERGYRVRPAISGELALRAAQKSPPDLILMDIQMPEMNGFEVCRRLKDSPVTREIPVIFISALDAIDDKLRAFEVGGVDYITKPFQITEVFARVEAQLTLVNQRRRIEAMLAQKDEFLHVVSHDLKNPISIIMGYTELMIDSDRLEEDQVMLLQIKRAAQYMLALTQDLLELGRAEHAGTSLELETTDINALIMDICAAFELQASQKRITMVHLPGGEPLPAQVDLRRIRQVFNNLLSNAIKYTPEHGRVEIHTYRDGNYAMIEVADNGLGIPAEDLPHLFEKFFRVQTPEHTQQEGTGLGLSIVQGYIQAHQGKIWVDSDLGKGSIFFVALPLST